jgi:hypothetical protein
MKYCIQPATPADVAVLANALAPDATEWGWGDETDRESRLRSTCAASTQVWAVHDRTGAPLALWGVSPNVDEMDVGCVWLLALGELEASSPDVQAFSSLVLDEMFSQYDRLENYVASDRTRTIELLDRVGFTIEPAIRFADADPAFHRVWMEEHSCRYASFPGARPVN